MANSIAAARAPRQLHLGLEASAAARACPRRSWATRKKVQVGLAELPASGRRARFSMPARWSTRSNERTNEKRKEELLCVPQSNEVKKRTVAVLGAVAVLAVAGIAIAYWTTTGSGSGSGAVATSNGTLVLHGTITGELTPGGSSPVAYTADNANSSSEQVGTVKAVVSIDEEHAEQRLPGVGLHDRRHRREPGHRRESLGRRTRPRRLDLDGRHRRKPGRLQGRHDLARSDELATGQWRGSTDASPPHSPAALSRPDL